jgi:hypothetical protein
MEMGQSRFGTRIEIGADRAKSIERGETLQYF